MVRTDSAWLKRSIQYSERIAWQYTILLTLHNSLLQIKIVTLFEKYTPNIVYFLRQGWQWRQRDNNIWNAHFLRNDGPTDGRHRGGLERQTVDVLTDGRQTDCRQTDRDGCMVDGQTVNGWTVDRLTYRQTSAILNSPSALPVGDL